MLLSSCDAQTAGFKNGFDLSNAIIPTNEILSGGPPKDGIPAINEPKFVSQKEAGFLSSKDRILGLMMDGVAKAYPIKILNWHEIVNDTINAIPFAVTYCPLCGTGIAFSSRVKGMTLKFGVSGLLYNSDVLLYDQKTQSLWSQILGKGVTGELVNTKLNSIPLTHTTWGHWKEKHSGTLVLSTETGFSRNYERNPYEGYNKSRRLYFEVSAQAPESYHPKEIVLGLDAGGIYKAYPFVELNKNGQAEFIEVVNDRSFTISWDSEHQSGIIADEEGKIIPVVQGFWFAWFAFHPDTIVYKAGN